MYKKALRFIFNGVEPVNDTVRASPLISFQGLYQVFVHVFQYYFANFTQLAFWWIY